MKKYLTYIAECDTRKKDASLNYYFVDYFNQTANSITLKLSRNSNDSAEFDYLAEDLLAFSQISEKLEIKAFSNDGHYRSLTIIYTG